MLFALLVNWENLRNFHFIILLISESPLQLIHSDLWTSLVPSMSGYKYYALFVDDYSLYSWFYPLYTKAETFDAFVKFKAFVENQFSTKIKQLQSDGIYVKPISSLPSPPWYCI